MEHTLRHMAKAGRPARTNAAPSSGFDGVWRNELGSTMTLSVSGNSVIGTYESPVSGTGSPVTGNIVGFVDDDVIAIVVRWNIASVSMTTWVGQVVTAAGSERINTLWHLIRNTPEPEEPEDAWAAVLAGADYFRR